MVDEPTYEKLQKQIRELEEQVNAQHNIEAALKEEEKSYRFLAENVNDVIWTMNMNMEFTYFSPSVTRLRGYSVEEALAQNVAESMTPASFDMAMAVFREEIKQLDEGPLDPERSRALELELTCKDGTTVWCEVEVKFIFDDSGHPTGIIGVSRDITERKHAEEKLRNSEARYRKLFEEAQDAIFLADADTGILVDCNHAAIELVEREKSELIGQHQKILHPPRQENNSFSETFQKHTGDREGELLETQVITRNGDIKHVSIKGNILQIGPKRLLQGIFHDITNRKAIEAQLQQAQKMEAMATLAGGIAHEFNNLLWLIIGNVELALDSIPKDNPACQQLDRVTNAAKRARNIVDQVLSFSKQADAEKRPLKIGDIIEESLTMLRASLPKTIEIQKDFSYDSDTVMAEPSQVRQILVNLCTNAAHAMQENGGIIKVCLANTDIREEDAALNQNLAPGKYLKLTVADTGQGIPEKIQGRIFDPFFTTKQVGKGTGMGLSVVHGIVKSYGGAITVESEPGKGASFHVLLPCIEWAWPRHLNGK